MLCLPKQTVFTLMLNALSIGKYLCDMMILTKDMTIKSNDLTASVKNVAVKLNSLKISTNYLNFAVNHKHQMICISMARRRHKKVDDFSSCFMMIFHHDS